MIVRKIRSSLRLKLVLASVIVEIVMLGLLLSNSVRLLNIANEEHAESHLQEIPLLLNAALAPLLFQRDFASIEDFLNDLIVGDQHGISYIVILDKSGQLYGSRGNVDPKNLPASSEYIKIDADQPILHASTPLKLAGRIIGKVRFGISIAHLIESKKSLIFQGSLIASSEIILTLVLLSFIGFMLTRHITRLVASTKLVSQGDHSLKIQVSGTDEIAVLAKSFNEMVSAVDEKTTALKESEEKYRSLFETSSDAIFIYDPESTNIIDANLATSKIYGYRKDELIGMSCLKFSAEVKESSSTIDKIREQGEINVPDRLHQKKDGTTFLADITGHSIQLNGKNVMFAVSKDITERRRAEELITTNLREKETLLQEIHHRVKNNMQVISSLLKLQSNSIDNEQIKMALKESQSRVYSMSAVHETLHESENLSEIDLNTYISRITNTIFQTYSANPDQVILKNTIEKMPISIKQASPLGLIVNELISNSLKYAFPDDRKGEIMVHMKKLEQEFELIVMDDGVGIPEGLDWKSTGTLGMELVRTLVENQLDGSIDMENQNGTKFTIKFNTDT